MPQENESTTLEDIMEKYILKPANWNYDDYEKAKAKLNQLIAEQVLEKQLEAEISVLRMLYEQRDEMEYMPFDDIKQYIKEYEHKYWYDS